MLAAVDSAEKGVELVRQLRLKGQWLPGDGMVEAKGPGVQGQPLVRPGGMARILRSISLIPQNRMPGFGKMHADLVASPRIGSSLNRRSARRATNTAGLAAILRRGR